MVQSPLGTFLPMVVLIGSIRRDHEVNDRLKASVLLVKR